MDNSMNKKCRALFLIDDTRDFTNDFYIFELTKIILFEAGSYTLTLSQICEKMEELTKMNYTEDEVKYVISIYGSNIIECQNGEYGLTSNGDNIMKKRQRSMSIDPFVKEFIHISSNDYELSEKEAIELVYRFIYERFNENIAQISTILNCEIDIRIEDEKYSIDDNTFINDFLAWNNPDKSKLVFDMIAKAFDYCMINSKCDKKTIDFSKFYFYIDTNIIFRLMGFNNEIREKTIKTFIDKCLSCGINIVISNFVYDECIFSIDAQIGALEAKTMSMNQLLSPQAMSFAEENSLFNGIYNIYFDWCRTNKHKNYKGFKKFMHQRLDSIISRFTINKDNTSFEVTNSAFFTQLYESLYEAKLDKHVAKTDVNSIMLVQKLRKNNVDDELFLISADGVLISWVNTCHIAESGLVDYPSTWLAVLLKYTGREKDDDFSSFCHFIHLPIQPDNPEDLRKKIEIKAEIMTSDFEDSIKENMIEDIKNHYYTYRESSVSDIVHKAYAKTEDKIRQEAINNKIEQIDAENKKTYDEQLEKNNNEWNKKEENYKNRIDETAKESFEKGKAQGEEDVLKSIAYKKAKRNRIIRKILSIICIVLFILFIGIMIITNLNKSPSNSFLTTLNNYKVIVESILLVFTVFSGIIGWGFGKDKFLVLDEKAILENLKIEHNKK